MAVSPVKHGDGLNEILAVLVRAIQGEPEQVPPGWFTAVQLADASGRSRRYNLETIQAALRAGTLEQRTFRVNTGTKLYPVPHYRLKNPAL